MRSSLIALVLAALLLSACSAVTVSPGDTVSVTYTGTYANGTVFDSNDPLHAADVPQRPVSSLVPMTVTLGQGRLIAGFEQGLIGMKEEETKSVIIKATDAYGPYKAELVKSIPKFVTNDRMVRIPRMVSAPRADLEAKLAKPLAVKQVFETENFIYSVKNLTNTTAGLYIEAMRNETDAVLEGVPWPSSLADENATMLILRQNPLDKTVVQTENGPYVLQLNATHIRLETALQVGQDVRTAQGDGRITRETADSVTLDLNHPLAGQDLTFTLHVDAIEPRK